MRWVAICAAGVGLAWARPAASAAGRETLDLTGAGWQVWLDREAAWTNDVLHRPGDVKLAELPVNPPTGGWEVLDSNLGTKCTLPAVVEEIFSGGQHLWTYHGVIWFWRDVAVPADWKGKTVTLSCDNARLRVELHVNGTLAGYDLVCETPVAFDISPFVKPGANNRLAFRVTNPGGSPGNERGFDDSPFVHWGSYLLPGSHDFGGLAGGVRLVATDPVSVETLFVKNLPPAGARNLELVVTLRNRTAQARDLSLNVEIGPWPEGAALYAGNFPARVPPAGDAEVRHAVTVPAAKLWDMDHPQLYVCQLSFQSDGLADAVRERFGFRVFEVREADGKLNYYLNGKRFRHRSAIDWGYYALTGQRATAEMARRSVENARAIGHNGINFHRHIGDPLVMAYADELGLYLYEEPGAFHIVQGYNIEDRTFAAGIMEEKCRRMVLRDRNHPSLVIFNMANEDGGWNPLRERVMRMIARLDGTRMINANSSYGGGPSGSMFTGKKVEPGPIPCIRPYAADIHLDYWDNHSVGSEARFPERELAYRCMETNPFVQYWGEVRCYTGPANWVATAALQQRMPDFRIQPVRPGAGELIAGSIV